MSEHAPYGDIRSGEETSGAGDVASTRERQPLRVRFEDSNSPSRPTRRPSYLMRLALESSTAQATSPLIPPNAVGSESDASRDADVNVFETAEPPLRDALLIYPKRIDDLVRFRKLFAGVVLFVVSSLQGVHSLYGTVYLQSTYGFTIEQMMIVYLCGQSFGLFVFPFGALYDLVGPRTVNFICTILATLGNILFALLFRGTIDNTKHLVAKASVFYAIMCWGCYGIDVATLPAVLYHMPRDRAQPISLLKTFSGLGSTAVSCIFRGFFNDNYVNLMWFTSALSFVLGIGGTIYLGDAPYVCPRMARARRTAVQQLRQYLIRNRYLSQLMPKRRFFLNTLVLVLINFYLTIQAVCAGWFQSTTMTAGKRRGLAIGGIIVTLLVVPVLLLPFRCIDGPSVQDEEVIERAHEKEDELRQRQRERRLRHAASVESLANREPLFEAVEDTNGVTFTTTDPSRPHEPIEEEEGDVEVGREGGSGGGSRGWRGSMAFNRSYAPAEDNQRPLVEVFVDESSDDENILERTLNNFSFGAGRGAAAAQQPQVLHASFALPPRTRANASASQPPSARGSSSAPLSRTATMQLAGDAPTSPLDNTLRALNNAAPSSYSQPRIETIHICGEVFVTPVYETSFFESLTYIDVWLMAWTTMCVWGIGITMTGNWNIQVMVQARWRDMDYKYYILFAALSGVCTAGGRVMLSIYDLILQIIRTRCGIQVVPTIGYPIASVGLFIAMIFWIALPGDKVLILAYILGPAFYGLSNTMTVYVLSIIFDRDLGMHYGFLLLWAAAGVVFFYRLSWYDTYKHRTNVSIPGVISPRCVGARSCMNIAVGIYLIVSFSSIITSVIVHVRYSRLVGGRLRHKRIFAPVIKKMVEGVASAKNNNNDSNSSDSTEDSRKKNGTEQ